MLVVGNSGDPSAIFAVRVSSAIVGNGAGIFSGEIGEFGGDGIDVRIVTSDGEGTAGKIVRVGTWHDSGSIVAIARSALKGAGVLQD